MTTLAKFEETIGELAVLSEPARSAALTQLAADVRATAWAGTHRKWAAEVVERAESLVDRSVDLLAGQAELARRGLLAPKS